MTPCFKFATKEFQIVYRLFLVNCNLLHVPRLPSQPASSRRGWVIDFIWLELPSPYIVMTRNNLSIILISSELCSRKEEDPMQGAIVWFFWRYKTWIERKLPIRHEFDKMASRTKKCSMTKTHDLSMSTSMPSVFLKVEKVMRLSVLVCLSKPSCTYPNIS